MEREILVNCDHEIVQKYTIISYSDSKFVTQLK